MPRTSWFSLTFFKDWALLTLSLASGGFTVLFGLVFYLQGKEPPKSGLLILLQVCSVVAAWGAWLHERRKRLDLLSRRRPRLVVPADGFYRISAGYPLRYANEYATALFQSLLLSVENDPLESSADAVARDISAGLTFLDSQGKELMRLEGRWSDSTQPPNLERQRTAVDLKTATIPIGAKRQLDLVLKYDGDTDSFALNNESYTFDLLLNPTWRLVPGDYQIKVRFRGVNVDQTFLLRFRNPKGGNEPLEPLSFQEIF